MGLGTKKKEWRTKKCGAESSDPNRHSQPRLPGSVVGEASMRRWQNCNKITKVRDLMITDFDSGQKEKRWVASNDPPGSMRPSLTTHRLLGTQGLKPRFVLAQFRHE